jgi:hypothetical protein
MNKGRETPQDVIRRLSGDASAVLGSVYHLGAISLHVDHGSRIIAEYWDFRDLEAVKHSICDFLAAHTCVTHIEIRYDTGHAFWRQTGSVHLTMADGSRLRVDQKGRHVMGVDAPDVPPCRVHTKGVQDLISKGRLNELRKFVPKYVHNSRGIDGTTMVHQAIRSWNSKVLEWLVQQPGTVINAIDRKLESAFTLAVRLLNIDGMKTLWRHGAIVYTGDDSQRTNVFHIVISAVQDVVPAQLYECVSFLGDHVPLSFMISPPKRPPLRCFGRSVDEITPGLVKGFFYEVALRVRQEVLTIVYQKCVVRALADIVMGYWQEWSQADFL